MPTITVNHKTFSCENGKNLMRFFKENNVFVTAPCGGLGVCGKCKVKLSPAPAPTNKEREFLGEKELAEGIRLACYQTILSDLSVTLPDISEKKELHKSLDSKNPLGFAVDIGTTTVGVLLADLKTKQILGSSSALNPQAVHGGDVISRIEFSNGGGLFVLHKLIADCIMRLCSMLCDHPSRVEKIVLTGNTTMLHLIRNISPEGIGVYPFNPHFVDLVQTTAKDIGIGLFSNAKAYLLPSLSAYVGADLLCAVLDSNLQENTDFSLLVDIGTNGEMALGNKDKLFACSTAAGPAFEGYNLTFGTGSVDGAISAFSEKGYQTINNKPPVGICGSGILDILAFMLQTGVLDESGYLEEPFQITDDIYVSQKDVRELQLAKSALASGVLTLIEESKVPIENIKNIYLAGGFGSFLNPKSALKIGLLPKGLGAKITALGNAALNGAFLALTDERNIRRLNDIRRSTRYIELSESPLFNEKFIEQMMF